MTGIGGIEKDLDKGMDRGVGIGTNREKGKEIGRRQIETGHLGKGREVETGREADVVEAKVAQITTKGGNADTEETEADPDPIPHTIDIAVADLADHQIPPDPLDPDLVLTNPEDTPEVPIILSIEYFERD